MKRSGELLIAIRAAKKAGIILRAHYRKKLRLAFKKGEEEVTEADILAEKKILQILRNEFPWHAFYSEEAGKDDVTSNFLWVIDPLDGTSNYRISNPFFNTSIALTYKGEPILGVVYNPIQKELFWAEKGKGAYCNGRRIYVSSRKELARGVMGFCHGVRKPVFVKRGMAIYKKLKMLATKNTRQFGSAALELCYVAAGRIEAFEMSDLNAYDVAAGAIIVKEAGGKVTDFLGKPFTVASRDILASNGVVHKQLLTILNQ